MKSRFLANPNEGVVEGNIYADKSSLVLNWLLRKGVNRVGFSLREVSKEIDVSVGLVQRVFSALILKGLLQTEGLRTAKKFFFKKPKQLLESWLEQYSIVKKCKTWSYRSGLSGKEEFVAALKKAKLNQKVGLALHSAVESYGHKNTSLDTFELYMLDPDARPLLEDALQLEPQERGYEVLLIEPYYKSLLNLGESEKDIKISPALLAFLDLYDFPLRGQEQAEFMAERIPELKHIYKMADHDDRKPRR